MKINKVIIDGVIFHECNGCLLYDGNVCTGAKTYEDNAERDRHICDEHLASQFWVVFKQLKQAEQKLEKIKEYCNSCNLKADFTACDILQIIKGEENE